MNKLKSRSGFTLLEIIIVIIIVGVLASLALPRFFRTIEYSEAQEALSNLAILRRSMNRCYMFDGSYATCNLTTLDVEDPGDETNALFTYSVQGSDASGFTLRAAQDADNSNYIDIDEDGNKSGAGIFGNIR